MTASAIIMMGVFGGFMLGSDVLIKSIGFAFAIRISAAKIGREPQRQRTSNAAKKVTAQYT